MTSGGVSFIGQWCAISDASVWLDRVVAVASIVVHALGIAGALDEQEGLKLTPAIVANATSREALVQRDGALIQNEVDICGRRAGNVGRCGITRCVERLGCVDDLNI